MDALERWTDADHDEAMFDHEAAQHTEPDTSPFFDAVYRRAGVQRKPKEIGHPSYEPESKMATDEDYPKTEMED
jgi:hypothetical protein